MSLTEQEKAWLERRKNLCSKCIHRTLGCILGKVKGKTKCNFFDADLGELDYKDAAEFEARVALWLIDKCDRAHSSLYQARLAVEQEMEKKQ